MLRLAPLATVLAIAIALAGCKPKTHERARVVVSIFPLYDFARRIAGEDADVALVLPPGQSARDAKLPSDAAQTAAHAKLLIEVGLGLDEWMVPLLASADPKARVIKVGDRAPTRTIGDQIDPYVWLDPQRARLVATAIVEEMARVDSSHAMAFRKRADDLDRSLAALDKEIEARTSAWTKRAFVTREPTFGYYAERYRLTVTVAKPGEPAVALDPLGGSAEADSYEKLLRFDTAALESALH